MINQHELMVWAAGIVEGCGVIVVSMEEGPTGKEYAAITLVVPVLRSTQTNRMMLAAGNGTETTQGWELSGIAAVRGFLESLWTWFTPESKTYANERLRKFKELQKLAS